MFIKSCNPSTYNSAWHLEDARIFAEFNFSDNQPYNIYEIFRRKSITSLSSCGEKEKHGIRNLDFNPLFKFSNNFYITNLLLNIGLHYERRENWSKTEQG